MLIHSRDLRRDDRERYDPWTIRLHWFTAILVVALWTLGQTIDWFPNGLARTTARSVHITLGLILLATLICRIGWRSTRGRRLPRVAGGFLDTVAEATHLLLYIVLVTTVALGVANAWIRGDVLFNVVAFPAYDSRNESLRGLVGNWHGLSANALLIVAAFHAGAGLFHHWVLRDRVLQRMLGTGVE